MKLTMFSATGGTGTLAAMGDHTLARCAVRIAIRRIGIAHRAEGNNTKEGIGYAGQSTQ